MDIRGLDLNFILLLDALIRDPNQTRVAKALKISQPTVSASLTKLRRILRDDLVVKSGGVYRATPRLAGLAPAIKQIVHVINRDVIGSAGFDPRNDTRTFVLTTPDVGEMTLGPALIESLSKLAPKVAIRSVVIKPNELEGALGEGTVDLAVGYFPDLVQSTIVQQSLFKHGFTCLVRKDHPTIGHTMSLEQFQAADHIVIAHEGRSQEVFENALRKMKLERRAAVQVPHFMSVPFLVGASDLVATVPKLVGERFAAHNNIRMVAPPMPTPSIEVKHFWHRRYHSDPRSIWYRTLIVKLFRERAFGGGAGTTLQESK
jgi:DNA-binding transcriptional LysR family regulator